MQTNRARRALPKACGKEPHLGDNAAQQCAAANGFAAAELGRYGACSDGNTENINNKGRRAQK